MADDMLSQDEIDALLKGVSGDEEEQSSAEESSGKKIRPYDPATQQRMIRRRLHGLDIINERFARRFRMALFNLIRRSADITVGQVKYQRYIDFTRNLPVPANINMIAIKPLRGNALIVFPPNVVFLVVDNLFGGDGRFLTKSEGREFTHTEQRLIQRLLNLALESYGEGWQSIFPVDLEYQRSEMQVKFTNIVNTPNELVINTTFHLEVGSFGSDFHICMPYSMLEPIKEELSGTQQNMEKEEEAFRRSKLAAEVKQSSVNLVATFGEIQTHLAQVSKMKVGDVFPFELPQNVIARIDGVPVLECDYGSSNGQKGLRVKRVIDHVVQETYRDLKNV
ncbi:flagellar motor switch protein FliM [Larsenimonas salina]|uniref:flagellar motor switch protein FliM n=1 Tax=Larsenimonas salina TaxID=1295565 RepID=UPI002073CBF7|nr:flagellar motor switch protein FliM [Larsenimonas salina]MCM5703716.1 flagellar motor switch protein FliM [Larsenimonas salina]